MKCKFCTSSEELTWPENYQKGDKPVNAETGKAHVCKADLVPEYTSSVYLCHECGEPVEFVCKTCGHVQVINVK